MPPSLKGNPSQLDFKRHLRSEMTEPERCLWYRIRSKQLNSLKFRRQHGIGPYIVDFYCPERALVIEIDGDTHFTDEQQKLDSIREHDCPV
ncbi:MAG: endonuclease domain-containing protein [bacterium]